VLRRKKPKRLFHHHHYRAGNIVVAAAGNVDHDRMVDGIAARFTGGLGSRPPRPEAEIRPAGAVRVLHRPTEQAHLVLGMPALSRSDPDRFALSVLNHVIGGGMSSRLFQEVREKRGLAYGVSTELVSFRHAGLILGNVATDEVVALETLRGGLRADTAGLALRRHGIRREGAGPAGPC